jgi:hypothetical protein
MNAFKIDRMALEGSVPERGGALPEPLSTGARSSEEGKEIEPRFRVDDPEDRLARCGAGSE